MTTYVADHETGLPLCADCGVGACHGTYICEAEHCRCWCRGEEAEQERRAAEMDDREPGKLHVIAAEIERENRPSVEALMDERFGRTPRSAV